MFEFESEDPAAEGSEQLGAWFDRLSSADVYILGSGVSALVAGYFLQQQGVHTVVLTEADTPGGRLVWKSGPVPIFFPTLSLLADTGYSISEENYAWINRLELVIHLTNAFFQVGGELLSGIIFEKITPASGQMQLELLHDRRSLVFDAVDSVITEPLSPPEELGGEADNVSEKMVLNTGRRSEGWIQAGHQAHQNLDSAADPTLVNGCLLSGRKASEIVLTEF